MRRSLCCLAGALWLTGCPAPPNDPPPPPRTPDIAVAPPRALGALAAGTDAAPRPEVNPGGELFEPDVPPSAPEVPAPAPEPEGSAPEPEPPAPPAPHSPKAPHSPPDAGMAL
jgi:two-component system, OmpR family, sensor histidine kinase MprB